MNTEAEPGKFPGYISNEVLAQRVAIGCQHFSDLLPLLEELRLRFAEPERTEPICGHDTWYGFLTAHGLKPGVVRKALAAERKKSQLSLDVFHEVFKKLKSILPAMEDGSEHKLTVNMEIALKTPIITVEERQTAELIKWALDLNIVHFSDYARRMADKLNAGVV